MELSRKLNQEEDYFRDSIFGLNHSLTYNESLFMEDSQNFMFPTISPNHANLDQEAKETINNEYKENQVDQEILNFSQLDQKLRMKNEPIKQNSTCLFLESINKDLKNAQEQNDKPQKVLSEIDSDPSTEYLPHERQRRKLKKRRDVIFKSILRECRRFFLAQISNMPGFVIFKNERNGAYLYKSMKKFNQAILKRVGTFEDSFYLAALLYPQDLKKNFEEFVKESKCEDHELTKSSGRDTILKSIIDRIHNTLYKYSIDRLNFFTSKPSIAFLFCYYYAHGAGSSKDDPKLSKEYEQIRQKCMDTLNKKASLHILIVHSINIVTFKID
ncbi:unnamed protein product [Moneuplotes crassus]|uniref:Uncharacterized protein n=1 Tax=Euplotes crassus TaxID=5936 RepID=A0AAD1XIF9_EUPCR|nr:unnamed protein product [Moneuplotes crassus]